MRKFFIERPEGCLLDDDDVARVVKRLDGFLASSRVFEVLPPGWRAKEVPADEPDRVEVPAR